MSANEVTGLKDYCLDPRRVAYYETDYGTIDVSKADADTLRSILTEVVIGYQARLEEAQARADRWIDEVKPRCFLCRWLNP